MHTKLSSNRSVKMRNVTTTEYLNNIHVVETVPKVLSKKKLGYYLQESK